MNVSNWNTYFAAVGLLGLAVYQFSQGDYSTAFQSFMAAVAAFGIQTTLASHSDLLKNMK